MALDGSRSTVRAAVEAFQEAEDGFQQIKRLLPKQWTEMGTHMETAVRQVMPEVQRFLQAPGTPPLRSAAQRDAVATNQAILESLHQGGETRCAGCGKEALGLRKCSRCRQAGYCR